MPTSQKFNENNENTEKVIFSIQVQIDISDSRSWEIS